MDVIHAEVIIGLDTILMVPSGCPKVCRQFARRDAMQIITDF